MGIPRVLIAGLRGGGGKTLVSLGLVAAWREQGYRVAPFKKGPDYIDAAWLAVAAEQPCRNLDLFLMSPRTVVRSFAASAGGADVAVIEGNRGLFDGMDAEGTYSTAELAKLLRTPVVLAVDCTKTTRTVAALVLGCQRLDPQVDIRGVILNQTAGARHDSVLRKAIEQECGLPVLGAVARIPEQLFPERHLGLVPPEEHEQRIRSIRHVAEVAEQYLDLQSIWDVAQQAPALELGGLDSDVPDGCKPQVVRIGVFRDAAFAFYYPENLEALARAGASLIEISPLRDARLPDVDALYIGGGFPETVAPALARNGPFIESLCRSIEKGLPVYAECGGAVYLGRRLLYDQRQYAMAGVLPLDFVFRARAQGHGYAVLEVVEPNAFYTVGQSIRGHEFHYTCIESCEGEDLTFALRVDRGYGFDGRRDGLCQGNVLACYTHVHALGTESWAPSLVRAAVRFRSGA
ncbi:MAG: cobyrinic acid a,c-diamide synthase [Planctomycetes bacterium RBG_13_63_9]|nr:MAG: cobyrinic acid a,c-diamide synthase [Planctomycetes bacterium RBG_13_63_9]